ncbi:Target of EGR1, member 1 (Nuclear) [Actinomortierella ambigua]|nr:Target of EGR1, member 1 (Nuclear) [Actinomortierella ambigua]
MSTPITAAASIPTHNQVTRDNLAELQPKVVELLKQATFIALDVEFTGFGDNLNATKASNVQERYENLCSIAKSHALIAFGLSIFTKKPRQRQSQQHPIVDCHQSAGVADQKGKDTDHGHNSDEDLILHGGCGWERAFVVHNFNFSMLKNHDFSVTPNSMRFLAETGVDLNQWAKEGILYKDGDDSESSGKGDSTAIMRAIVKRIMTRHVPIVLSTFTADLSDMFPAGIYDTKYISDYVTREPVSFLSYLFRKYERKDTQTRLKLASVVSETTHCNDKKHKEDDRREDKEESSDHLEEAKKGTKKHKKLLLHGHCRNGTRCERTHDLDAILDHEESKHKKTHKKQRMNEGSQNESEEDSTSRDPVSLPETATAMKIAETTSPAPLSSSSIVAPLAEAEPTIENSALTPEKFHSAYFDAYMTGTVFSHQLNLHTRTVIEKEARNRVYLIGKSFPLATEKSSYAQYSPGHIQKSRGGRTL